MCETWLNDSNNINNYNSFHVVRERGHGRGGGVSIFCKSSIHAESIDCVSLCSDTIEACALKVSINNETLVVGIYRPHSDSVENFSRALNELLEDRSLYGCKVCLAGDFNINSLDEGSNSCISFVNTMQSLHYMPLITKPTRFPPDENSEPTLLDHIWVNYMDVYTSGILLTDTTDHCPIFFY